MTRSVPEIPIAIKSWSTHWCNHTEWHKAQSAISEMLITKDWCQERWPLLSQFPFLTTNAEQPDKIYSEGWRKQGILETLHDQSKAQLSHNTYVDRRSTNTNCN